eukprot:scaffold12002_cov115-Isochrysis_galbana.AAC.10
MEYPRASNWEAEGEEGRGKGEGRIKTKTHDVGCRACACGLPSVCCPCVRPLCRNERTNVRTGLRLAACALVIAAAEALCLWTGLQPQDSRTHLRDFVRDPLHPTPHAPTPHATPTSRAGSPPPAARRDGL